MSKKHGKHHRGQKHGRGVTDGDDLNATAGSDRPSTARWASAVDTLAESEPAALRGHRATPIVAAPGVVAVEPGAGEVAWERRLGSAESPEVSMLDGVTLVSDGTAHDWHTVHTVFERALPVIAARFGLA